MRVDVRRSSLNRLLRLSPLGALLMAPALAGCSIGMPSASSMPAFQSKKPRAAGLGGPNTPSRRGPGQVIVVGAGDTLMGLSRRFDVPMSVLMEQNGLRSIALEPGTELFIPKLQSNTSRPVKLDGA
jgi:LysM domain